MFLFIIVIIPLDKTKYKKKHLCSMCDYYKGIFCWIMCLDNLLVISLLNEETYHFFKFLLFFFLLFYSYVKFKIVVQKSSKSVNGVSDGVRVSSGHLCEAEAPTEAVAETSFADSRCSSYNHKQKEL